MNLPLRRFSSQLLKFYSQMIWSSPCIEKVIPKSFMSPQHLATLTHVAPFTPDFVSYNEGLCNPLWSMVSRAGKTWRGTFCLLTAQAFGKEVDKVLPLAVCCELLHNGSLIIDDLQDKSDVRRGKPAVHILYSPELAINAGCYLCFIAQLALNEAQLSDAVKLKLQVIYSREVLSLHLGQCSDLYWNKLTSLPTLDQYYQMVCSKTGALIRLAIRLGAVAAECPEATITRLIDFSDNLGIAFQITDDFLNLQSLEYANNRKCIGEDITEGKRSIITIRAIEKSSAEQGRRLMDILAMTTRDQDLITEAIDIIRSTDALQYAQNEATKYLVKAMKILEEVMPDSEAKAQFLSIAQYLIERQG